MYRLKEPLYPEMVLGRSRIDRLSIQLCTHIDKLTMRNHLMGSLSTESEYIMTHTDQKYNFPSRISSMNTSSTSTTASTEPGVLYNENDLLSIKQAYNDCIGDLKAAVAWYLEGLIKWGMEPEVILNAINETGWAKRPSPQYMRAILERYKAHGIKSMPHLLHDQEEFAETKHWYE